MGECLNKRLHLLHGVLLLLLLLSRFSRVRLCVTPETAAHQALPSLGFSRQEHWSGLPLPSPVHESEKWKWSRSVLSNCLQPHGLKPTRLLRPWDFPGKSTGVGCHCLLRHGVLVSNKKEWSKNRSNHLGESQGHLPEWKKSTSQAYIVVAVVITQIYTGIKWHRTIYRSYTMGSFLESYEI